MIVAPTKVDGKVLTFREPGPLQPLPERGYKLRRATSRRAAEKADHWHCRLLRTCCKRPCRRRAAEQGNDLPPPHPITSSASASSDGGTVRPSAFAVARLITNWNLEGCSTGRSAGFVPLRIRST